MCIKKKKTAAAALLIIVGFAISTHLATGTFISLVHEKKPTGKKNRMNIACLNFCCHLHKASSKKNSDVIHFSLGCCFYYYSIIMSLILLMFS